MFYPLVSLEFIDRGMSVGTVGLLVGLLSGTGQTLSVFIGRVNAKCGSKWLAIGGLGLRAAGLLVFAVEDLGLLVYAIGAVIASIGSGATALAIKTELMRTSLSRRTITLRAIAVNIGALAGPAIGGAVFFLGDFSLVIVAVCLSYVLLVGLLLFVQWSPPEEQRERKAGGNGLVGAKGSMFSRLDVSFLALLACTAAYWGIYAMWPLVMPIFARNSTGDEVASSWAYTGNAVIILACQYILLVRLLSNVRTTRLLVCGYSLFLVSAGLFVNDQSIWFFVLFVVGFTFGELIVSPSLDELTGKLRRDGAGMTRAYGWTGTIGGIASLVGSVIVGVTIEAAGLAGGVIFASALALMGAAGAIAISRRSATL